LLGSRHLSLGLVLLDVIHVGHLWLERICVIVIPKALTLVSASTILVASILLLTAIITSLHHALGLFLSVEDHELLAELLVRHAKLLTDLNKASEAIDVVVVFIMDLLVNFESIVEEVHSPITGGDHELPFHFFILNLGGTFEEKDGLLEHVLFRVVHTQARDYIDFGRVIAI